MGETLYNCKKAILNPPENFIKYNSCKGYKDSIQVDSCIAEEIRELWEKGIRTTGCCCGHGKDLGYIEVNEEDISKMIDMGYVNYIYPDDFGGMNRKDAFIPKSYGHDYEGYSEGYLG